MKKVFLSLMIFHWVYINIPCNSQTIPNPGFENWTSFGGWFENPDGWKTNNFSLSAPVVKDTIAYQGNYAVRVNFNGYTEAMFPFSNHPADMKAFVRTGFVGSDTVSIQVLVYYYGVAADSGKWINTNLSPINTWTQITIPITKHSLSADSVKIRINGGKTFGDYLSVDALLLETTNGIKENKRVNNVTIYPNPFSEYTTLIFENLKGGEYSLNIFNLQGQLVRSISNLTTGQLRIERENLSSGLYIYKISNDNFNTEGKLIVK